jgi:hypothetical protein
MLSQNIVPSPRTRATVGHHGKITSLPRQICTLNERVTGEERPLIRCSLCRLAATGLVAIRVAGVEIATVVALASTESRLRVCTAIMDLPWVKAKLKSSSNTTTAHTRDVNGQWQEVFDLSYTFDGCMAIDCPSPFSSFGPQTGCYTPLPL